MAEYSFVFLLLSQFVKLLQLLITTLFSFTGNRLMGLSWTDGDGDVSGGY